MLKSACKFPHFPFTDESLKIKRDLKLFSRPHLLQNFLIKFFFCHVTQIGQVSLLDCVYFPSYLVKSIPRFMLSHLMTSWNLRFSNSKISLTRTKRAFEVKWKKSFYIVSKELSFRRKPYLLNGRFEEMLTLLNLSIFPRYKTNCNCRAFVK